MTCCEVIKSKSSIELLGMNTEMTLYPDSNTVIDLTKLKRTFTLPRNPFNSASARMSKRSKIKVGATAKDVVSGGSPPPTTTTTTADDQPSPDDPIDNNKNTNNKKVFRRPSIRRFINRIAQHIGGVPASVISSQNDRVPLIGLQTWGPHDVPGVTGLKNHGNTCFINAVLQCISNTDCLAEYFVLDRYKVDLTKRNKLNSKKFGTRGEVTEQLALLLKALWACQYSPELSVNFKQIVERHGVQYKGNQQHDALEFLQWLLDKVHEDLNTASKRKYKSIKTSGRPDEVIAAETLENYKRCNNSFIQGIFQAQYRSSLSCSRCRAQSNTFDPFQCISVQLPQFQKHSIFVTVLYTSQQPRQVQIGLSMPSGATVSELRDILESDTSIARANMLITEIGDNGFLRNFTDQQSITIISEIDPIYCIEVAQLKDVEEDTCTSAYILLCWINILLINIDDNDESTVQQQQRFGSPYTMQVSRDTSYDDLQKLILKEMASILHDDILTESQKSGIFKIRISDPACNDNEPPCYLDSNLEHPLFMEAIDQALALCSEEGGPPHVKFVLEFTFDAKQAIIADDCDLIDEHSSVKLLRTQALHGGVPLTLEECLRDYTEAETLTDAWRCPVCQQYQPVIKTLDVWSLPDILVVHFKRFRQQSLRAGSSTKLTTMVDFPVDNFDMSPHLASKRNNHHNHHHHNHNNNGSDNDNNLIHLNNGGGWSPWKRATRKQSHSNENIYDLYAICYHHGSDLETGHYTAACKNPNDNQWYLYDDAKVTNLTQETNDINTLLVNNSAYILFYQKRNNNNGFYVGNNNITSTSSTGSSQTNSSAASTSSSSINNDHWVTRMLKFQPPKNYLKVIEKRTALINNDNDSEHHNKDVAMQKKLPVGSNDDIINDDNDKVAFKNSQNTLNNINNNNDNGSCLRLRTTNNNNSSSQTALSSRLSLVSNSRNDNNLINTNQKTTPIYTTSIYINSCGDAEISTTCGANNDKSPVLSLHRVNGIIDDDDDDDDNDDDKMKVYTTVASVYRSSADAKCLMPPPAITQLNWMTPQPTRKLNQSQQSV